MIDMVGDSRNSNTVKQPQGNQMEMWKFPRSKISSDKTITEEEDDKLEEAGCISLRAMGVVICTMCGHSWKGRIRKIWGVHPMRVYSKDVFSCTNCGVKFGRTLSASWSPEAGKRNGIGRTRNISSLSVIFTCKISWIMYMVDTSYIVY